MNLTYSDGIAASLTTIALQANTAAIQARLPSGWELIPFGGDDVRGRVIHGANVLVVFHEIFAVKSQGTNEVGVSQMSYVVFVSLARNQATGSIAIMHWCTYTEDPDDVPGHYKDGRLAHIKRALTFTKERPHETHVNETFSAVADSGEVSLSLDYRQGGLVVWLTADEPSLPFVAANDPGIVRWYQEDQVFDVVRSDELKIDCMSAMSLVVRGELADVFAGRERIVSVFIRRPYMRNVYVAPVTGCPHLRPD